MYNTAHISGIDQYFSLSPSDRKAQNYSIYIKSTIDIYKILALGNTRNIEDGYDAAVDLLAHTPKSILLEAVNFAKKNHLSKDSRLTAIFFEKSWDILIGGLSCNINIPETEVLSVLSSLYTEGYQLTRLIKLDIIDCIIEIAQSLDEKLPNEFDLKQLLNPFTTEQETDKFIRNYTAKSLDLHCT